ncbi:c-type cytochrome [Paenibacillus sp. sgz302251]|uniref:c-type cytochrome n=1 Tax=Paenibacillus sp. sgz302251 TaxID=3414493 RepID=UPI003C7E85B4
MIKHRDFIFVPRLLGRSVRLAACTGLLLALTGCGGVKESAIALDGPAEVMTIYKANCVNCHGSELQGRVGSITNLQKIGAKLSAADIMRQIEGGEGTMPPFKDRLTSEEIAGLADWLATKK